MRPHPMTMQMARPIRVPTHTCSKDEINWGLGIRGTGLSGTYLSPQLLIDGSIVLGTQLLLEEREQNGDDDSGLYRFTKDNEEDGDGEHIRHGDGEDLNRVSEGRFGLERLQSLCSRSSCLCEV